MTRHTELALALTIAILAVVLDALFSPAFLRPVADLTPSFMLGRSLWGLAWLGVAIGTYTRRAGLIGTALVALVVLSVAPGHPGLPHLLAARPHLVLTMVDACTVTASRCIISPQSCGITDSSVFLSDKEAHRWQLSRLTPRTSTCRNQIHSLCGGVWAPSSSIPSSSAS